MAQLPAYSKQLTLIDSGVPGTVDLVTPPEGYLFVVRQVLLAAQSSAAVNGYVGVDNGGGLNYPITFINSVAPTINETIVYWEGRIVVPFGSTIFQVNVGGVFSGYVGGYLLSGIGTL